MRVLYLTHRLPYAPNRGDRIRAYYTLRVLRGHADVDVVSLVHDTEEASHRDELSALAASVTTAPVTPIRNHVRGAIALPSARPLTHALLDSPVLSARLARLVAEHPPDVVLAYCSGMARLTLQPPLAGLPFVVDLVDVDSLKWRALAASQYPPLAWIYGREATCLATFEAASAGRAVTTLVVNDREAVALKKIAPDASVTVVPSGVEYEYWRPKDPPGEREDVVFCGIMNYRPNEEGAEWLAREVWPLVRRRRPSARLRLVGAQPTRRVRNIPSIDSSIAVTGAVPDVRPFLWGAAVAVAPLHLSRGIQNKVLEAVAAGVPAVITSAVAAGLPAEIHNAVWVADDPGAFAEAIVQGLEFPPSARRARAMTADLEALSWERRLAPLIEILTAAARAHPK